MNTNTLLAIHAAVQLNLALATHCQEINVNALAVIESNSKMTARGSKGERTAWQILPTTWKQYAPVGSKLTSRPDAYTVALIIYCDNGKRFVKTVGRQPNNFDMYAMWNLGFAGYKRRKFDIDRCPAITRRAAMKYHTLCSKLYQEN